jgi:hypothetical protein
MTRKILLWVIGFTLLTGSIHARIGETQEECVARYGAVVEKKPAKISQSDPEAHLFSKKGITIWVEFRQGKAWRIAFRKLDMIDVELEALLRANMSAEGWGAALDVNGRSCRRSLDSKWVAITTPARHSREPTLLEIASRDYAEANFAAYDLKVNEARSEKKQNAVPAALEGF